MHHKSEEEDDEDPVVMEIPVFLSQRASENIRLLQYPIRTTNRPLQKDKVCFIQKMNFPLNFHMKLIIKMIRMIYNQFKQFNMIYKKMN